LKIFATRRTLPAVLNTHDPRSEIALELDELGPRLMDTFIAQGDLPNVARLKRTSTS
jgi:hypothetical protein